jgi:predicted MFS family arabinose efflux permease
MTYLPLLIHSKFGSSPFIIGLVMSSVSLTTAITTTKTRWLLTEWKERQLMVIGFILIAAAMLLFPLMPHVALLALPALVYGLGNGINSPSAQSILIGLAPENARAGFLSVNSTILRIGQSLGPFVMGMVAEAYGMNGMFYTAAACSLAMLAITVILLK